MYKPFIHIFLLLIIGANSNNAQNLVFNGDFEDYSECPDNTSNNLNKQLERCVGWKIPTWGTSDYFNTCCINNFAGVPDNNLGSQFPYSGNGYLGFFTYSITGGAGGDYSGVHWWEYVQGHLTQPLETGKTYELSFWLCLAEQSQLSIDKIGVYFSSDSIRSNTTQPLDVTPQITSPEGVFYNDTANWTMVKLSYLAQGGEYYLTIGNFNDSSTTDTLHFQDLGWDFPVCYYYLDKVMLTETDFQIELPNVFTPNGDEINDVFKIIYLTDVEYTIYNRWGQAIYVGNVGWNGRTTEGKECPEGTYYYVARNKGIELKGTIQLLR